MGDIADDMIDGVICQQCGMYLEEFLDGTEPDGFGYPVTCSDCRADSRKKL
jgi:hypothetical protein